MKAVWALFCLAVLCTSAHAISTKLVALEGDWANDCKDAADSGFAIRYSFEFVQSGGSIHFDDGVDLWWQGTVTNIQADGKGFVFTYSRNRTQEPERLRAELAANGRLRLSVPGKWHSTDMLVRCARADHRPVAKLSWQKIASLTPSRSRFVYFIEGESCAKADAYLHFDLIGPASYSVWGDGGSWKVVDASDDHGAVKLRLDGDAGPASIAISFPDPRHIVIEPWHQTWLRCEE